MVQLPFQPPYLPRAAHLMVLLAVAAAAVQRSAARPSPAPDAAVPARRLLDRRGLLECGQQCPDAATADATCSALDPMKQNSIRNSLISSCSNVVLAGSSGTCCDMLAAQSPTEWQETMACMCAGSGGLSAFVTPTQILAVCSCTAGTGNGSTASPSPGPAAPPALGRSAGSVIATANASATGAPGTTATAGAAANIVGQVASATASSAAGTPPAAPPPPTNPAPHAGGAGSTGGGAG